MHYPKRNNSRLILSRTWEFATGATASRPRSDVRLGLTDRELALIDRQSYVQRLACPPRPI